jgi:hypothetical protein
MSIETANVERMVIKHRCMQIKPMNEDTGVDLPVSVSSLWAG